MNIKWTRLSIPLLVWILSAPALALADSVVVDFEGLNDGEVLTTQFPGLEFSNTLALTSGFLGGSLNELENPPHSGVTVVTDDGGPISIRFLSPATTFGGFFTYGVPLVVTAFDQFGTQLGSASSLFSNNRALSGVAGSHPNELIALSFAQGISRIVITGDASGNSFVLDDLSANVTAAVPEPGTLGLVFAGGLAMLVLRRRYRTSGNAD
jgi:hypothetical protein